MIKGKIISATPGRSGVSPKTGKKWQKIDIVIAHDLQPNGEMFGTFDDQFLRLVGQEGEFEYEQNQWGKTLLRLPRQNSADKLGEHLNKIEAALEDIKEMVSILLPPKNG